MQVLPQHELEAVSGGGKHHHHHHHDHDHEHSGCCGGGDGGGRGRAAHAAGKTVGVFCYSNHGENYWLLSSARKFEAEFSDIAGLPSMGSKIAPPDLKGTAMGVYNTLQSVGLFVGGASGGAS